MTNQFANNFISQLPIFYHVDLVDGKYFQVSFGFRPCEGVGGRCSDLQARVDFLNKLILVFCLLNVGGGNKIGIKIELKF